MPRSKYELDILTIRGWYGDTWKQIGHEKVLASWIPELVQALIAHLSWKLGRQANLGPAKKIGNISPRCRLVNGDRPPGYAMYLASKIDTAYWKLSTPWRNETATEAFHRIIALCNYGLVLDGLEETVVAIEDEHKRIAKEDAA